MRSAKEIADARDAMILAVIADGCTEDTRQFQAVAAALTWALGDEATEHRDLHDAMDKAIRSIQIAMALKND